ncbi:MAG TPA: WecB/TagA/CpsF family glycosyltransferase [Burkholderiaceae bacterium]|nr:WecB/TagA/CpsF family glycosyltransferase [Burkholderiaceae bacterium]
MKPRVRILNGHFDPLTMAETVDAVFKMIRSGARGWLCTVNVSTLMAMRRDPTLQTFAERASIVVADGQPLVWCAPLFDGHLPERVTGIDLIDALCERAAAAGAGVYLLGSTAELLARALHDLRSRHPRLHVDGADGYFDAAGAAVRADAIRASGAAILLVGMGSPRQESFIAEQWERLGANVAIGVGGSFDVLAHARFRAPRWLRRAGLEWLVRLLQEPRRLLPRYLATNTQFCALIADAIGARVKRWIAAS